jgi:hypothetical protein
MASAAANPLPLKVGVAVTGTPIFSPLAWPQHQHSVVLVRHRTWHALHSYIMRPVR